MPLNPDLLKNGYAFPSGHMQSSSVFYLWLVYNYNNCWMRMITIILLIGIFVSLIYFNYHNYIDCSASVVISIIYLAFYIKVFKERL